MTMQQQAKAAKLIVLVRYFVKKAAVVNGVFYPAGSVVLRVRNYKGVEYMVVLRRNKIHECNCPHVPSHKCPECYHILQTKETENTKAQATREAAQAVKEAQAIIREQAHKGAQDIEHRLATAGFLRR